MKNEQFFEMIKERNSTRVFDSSTEISSSEITELLDAAMTAPSAWNLQHWKFVVFHGENAQGKLLPVAYNQAQIKDASCVIAVLADTQSAKNVDLVFGPAVEAGFMTQEAKDKLKANVEGAYATEQRNREQGILNSSLAGMQLIMAASAKGWNTCAIGGFNEQAFKETFLTDDRYIPTMLIAIGKEKVPGHHTTRFSAKEMSIWI
ncbi:nitroreductase family protein [Bacillus sp. AFS088145]|uniref:nitroreductase family protein n=1 Tax=Bacillus sp. AFS088145 TaxID=2033514 RepID=UPI000BF3A943|nr:nitroreductase family protein [Bacillus sp. AFS088145]PFH81347.1 nitroreductase family protein [Bacillus sp. AFS088145]